MDRLKYLELYHDSATWPNLTFPAEPQVEQGHLQKPVKQLGIPQCFFTHSLYDDGGDDDDDDDE